MENVSDSKKLPPMWVGMIYTVYIWLTCSVRTIRERQDGGMCLGMDLTVLKDGRSQATRAGTGIGLPIRPGVV